jgi:TolB protein
VTLWIRALAIVLAAWITVAVGAGLGAAEATFPGGNGEVAFSRSSPNGHWQIYVAGPGGGRPRRLTHGRPESFDPAYSADGEQIAFTQRRRAGKHDVYDIAVMGDDGGRPRLLGHGSTPAFALDGRKLAFTCDRNRSLGICVMNSDGSHVRLLARRGTSPAYSPGGHRIAFKGSLGIFVMNADGTHRRQLTRSPVIPPNGVDNYPGYRYFDWAPRFSPDGDRIVFVRQDGTMAAGYGDVYVMDASGKHVRALTPHGRYFNSYSDATFSPDGRRIAFGDGGHLYVMRPNGTHRHVLFKGGSADGGLDWQTLSPEGE